MTNPAMKKKLQNLPASLCAWILVIILLAGALSIPLARFLFTEISFRRILFSFFYQLYVYCIFLFLMIRMKRSRLRLIDAYLFKVSNVFRRKYFSQTLGAWVVAIFVSCIVAGYAGSKISAGTSASQAIWISILVDVPVQKEPKLRIATAPDGDSVDLLWQPYSLTHLGVKSLDGSSPVLINEIMADGKVISFDKIKTYGGGQLLGTSFHLANGEKALLEWEGYSRSINITFGKGNGHVEVLWNDKNITASLSSSPQEASLSLGAKYQGWALLPVNSIDRLYIELMHFDHPVDIRQIVLWEKRSPIILEKDLLQSLLPNPSCGIIESDGHLQVTYSKQMKSAQCKFGLSVPSHAERTNVAVKFLIWLGLSLMFLAALWSLRIANFVIEGKAWSEATGSVQGTSIDKFTWIKQRSTEQIMLFLFLAALIFHIGYTFLAPWGYNIDSLAYYDGAKGLLNTMQLAATGVRTPGYPGLIALTILLFGDNFMWIILFQHLSLALLAPLAYWSLKDRLGAFFAFIAALLAGISPAISVAANMIMAESVFSALLAAAFFVYIRKSQNKKLMIVSGILIGLAMLVRPSGLIIILVFCTWELLKAWFSSDINDQVGYFARSVLLGVGCIAVFGLWAARVIFIDHSLDMSRGLSGVGFWVNSAANGIVSPELNVNRPDRSIWYFPEAWNRNPFEIYYSAFSPVATAWSDWASLYYSESIREGIEKQPQRYLDILLVSLKYNFSLRWNVEPETKWEALIGGLGNGKYIYYPQLTVASRYYYFGNFAGYPEPLSPSTDLPYNIMAYHYLPSSPMRGLVTGLSMIALENWLWLAILVSASILFMLFHLQWRDFIAGWGLWLAFLLSHAALGFAADRYIVVLEPILYTLAIICVASLNMLFSPKFNLTRVYTLVKKKWKHFCRVCS
jgi:hypothetical protein